MTNMPEVHYERKPVSHKQLQQEYDYFLALRMLENLLQNGLITLDEFNKTTALNRKSFSPALAEIMPEKR